MPSVGTTNKMKRGIVTTLIFPLRICQILGLLPLVVQRRQDGFSELSFRWLSFPIFWSFGLTSLAVVGFIQGVHFRSSLWEEADVLKTLRTLCVTFHSVVIVTNYIYYVLRCRQFKQLLVDWDHTTRNLKFSKADVKMKHFAMMVSVVILMYAVVENTMYVYTVINTNMKEIGPYEPIKYKFEKDKSLSVRLHESWKVEIRHPYSMFIVLGKIFRQAVASYSWSFVDALVVVLFRALSFHFQSLVNTAIAVVAETSEDKLPGVWENIRCEFEQLCGLLKKLNEFLSPPLLLAYVLNVVLMAMHLSQWISSKGIQGGHGMTMYASMTSSLLILRTGMVTYYASEIHEHAHQILAVAGKCSSSTYSISLERLERKLAAQRVGVNVGGIFFVSRSLFASITSVIFTIEIFLLQAGQPAQSQSSSSSENPV